jgi:hypothetical protein
MRPQTPENPRGAHLRGSFPDYRAHERNPPARREDIIRLRSEDHRMPCTFLLIPGAPTCDGITSIRAQLTRLLQKQSAKRGSTRELARTHSVTVLRPIFSNGARTSARFRPFWATKTSPPPWCIHILAAGRTGVVSPLDDLS